MRLLNTKSLAIEEFYDSHLPTYAILSHTWESEEVTFQDLSHNPSTKAGYAKVKSACALAKSQGYSYIWIDTCCIDKTSSAELIEAINSMFRWYKLAAVCFAYLSDVVIPRRHVQQLDGRILASRWFTRGWTLQELLAPKQVEFYATDWQPLGSKVSLNRLVALATGIDADYLLGRDLRYASVAERMSWASKRQTTRVEDMAYSLLGIFDVNMPMIYGEGEKAFRRLQEEILKTSDDQSILAWGYGQPQDEGLATSSTHEGEKCALLARSPRAFVNCGGIVSCKMLKRTATFELVVRGLLLETPLCFKPAKQAIARQDETEWLRSGDASDPALYAPIQCRLKNDYFNVLAIPLVSSARLVDLDDMEGVPNRPLYRSLGPPIAVPSSVWTHNEPVTLTLPRAMPFAVRQPLEIEQGILIRTLPQGYALSATFPHDAGWGGGRNCVIRLPDVKSRSQPKYLFFQLRSEQTADIVLVLQLDYLESIPFLNGHLAGEGLRPTNSVGITPRFYDNPDDQTLEEVAAAFDPEIFRTGGYGDIDQSGVFQFGSGGVGTSKGAFTLTMTRETHFGLDMHVIDISSGLAVAADATPGLQAVGLQLFRERTKFDFRGKSKLFDADLGVPTLTPRTKTSTSWRSTPKRSCRSAAKGLLGHTHKTRSRMLRR